MPPLILCCELPGSAGGLAVAAALGVAVATDEGAGGFAAPVLLVELGGGRARGPTMLAADGARSLERALRDEGLEAAARGHLAWLRLAGDEATEALAGAIEHGAAARAVVVACSGAEARALLDAGAVQPDAIVLRADLPAQRALAALAVRDLGAEAGRVRVVGRGLGRVAARRAIAGIDPGGDASRRMRRLARRLLVGARPRRAPAAAKRRTSPALAGEAGQALPLALGGIFALVFCALLLAALGGAVTGTSRTQRTADLAALSAARSMRDDFERLFVSARRRNGVPNPAHLSKLEYLARAKRAAVEAAERNGVAPERVEVAFPDGDSFAPLRAAVEVRARLDVPGAGVPVEQRAVAEAVTPSDASAPAGQPATATGGGYAGPLAYRQGEPMRPDAAAAFDRMTAEASADGVSLVINSAYRSDAEQAALFAENPDPQWVAPPGTSLHRCATELDLGPPSAYGWLAANARRFGFVQRYAWEAWHYGFVDGPAPCSAGGDAVGDGEASAIGLPAFVPARFRAAIATAAGRWNVPAALLAAQLMAESNFNPFAVSSAGAQGIAQFIPSTAAAYGLDDPFDAEASIDAQAHLMSDLLEQFGGQVPLALAAYNAGPAPVGACGCVPSIPETQAYVARILGLMDGAGAIAAAPTLEVRLVE
jgi:hypothetical protein